MTCYYRAAGYKISLISGFIARERSMADIAATIPVFIIKNNLRTLGIDRHRYFELLEK